MGHQTSIRKDDTITLLIMAILITLNTGDITYNKLYLMTLDITIYKNIYVMSHLLML